MVTIELFHRCEKKKENNEDFYIFIGALFLLKFKTKYFKSE